NELSYITGRSNNVLSQITGRIPSAGFAITTPGPLTVNGSTATVAGNGWVNIRGIRLAGGTALLPVTWTGSSTWQVAAPIPPGPSTLTLEAVNFSGAVVGTASLSVNNTTPITPAAAHNLVISELMYHPDDLTPEEEADGFTDPDQFEYLEVMNIGGSPVNLTGVRFTSGIDYDFASGSTLSPGERLIIVRDRTAFFARHPEAAARLAPGAFLNVTGLNNSGEGLLLTDAQGAIIKSFAYDDVFPWPASADGTGRSLVLVAPATNPDHALPTNWRASVAPGGTPGGSDAIPFTGIPSADADCDGLTAFVEHAIGTSDLVPNSASPQSDASRTRFTINPDGYLEFSATRNLAADEAILEAQWSTDLNTWDAASMILVSESPETAGTSTLTWRSLAPLPARAFIRLDVRAR
ncbi:MAG: lamin tail domain-containing protein, partial [Verrucomicrobiales bacterium]